MNKDMKEKKIKHIKSHKSSFRINVVMMENVLFIKGEEQEQEEKNSEY